MKLKDLQLEAEQLSGISTVLLVAGLDIWLLLNNTDATSLRMTLLALMYALFALTFLVTTQDEHTSSSVRVRWLTIVVQYLLVCGVMYTTPHMFSAILLVIWSAQMPYIIPFRAALLFSPLWSVIPWCVSYWRWQSDGTFISGALFFTFSIFALIMMESRRNAELQKDRAEQANRELIAMQSLVREVSKQDERMRIARDIHDVVGHHLTALTVQLQVLSRKVPETLKPDVECSRAISKLLLADVRAAVSEMRAHEQIDLREALEALVANLPDIEVQLVFPKKVAVLNLEHAMAVLRGVQESVTNSLKHGNATRIKIEIAQSENELVVCVHDNGQGGKPVLFGNGLNGMLERIQALQGSLDVEQDAQGVTVRLTIPAHV